MRIIRLVYHDPNVGLSAEWFPSIRAALKLAIAVVILVIWGAYTFGNPSQILGGIL